MAPGTNTTKGRSYFSYSEVVENPITPFVNSSEDSKDILVINDEILDLTKKDFLFFITELDKKEK